jgi:hypothetical protein
MYVPPHAHTGTSNIHCARVRPVAQLLGMSIDAVCLRSRYGCQKVMFVLPIVGTAPLAPLAARQGWRIIERGVPLQMSDVETQGLRDAITGSGDCGGETDECVIGCRSTDMPARSDLAICDLASQARALITGMPSARAYAPATDACSSNGAMRCLPVAQLGSTTTVTYFGLTRKHLTCDAIAAMEMMKLWSFTLAEYHR